MKIFIVLVFLLFAFLNSSNAASVPLGDSISVDSLRSKANDIQSKANELKPKATELKQLFEGYKTKASHCKTALDEAKDGLDMAEKALKGCEDAIKQAAQALKAKKPKDIQKLVASADKKVNNAKYFIHQSEDRKKEAEFELRGCH